MLLARTRPPRTREWRDTGRESVDDAASGPHGQAAAAPLDQAQLSPLSKLSANIGTSAWQVSKKRCSTRPRFASLIASRGKARKVVK